MQPPPLRPRFADVVYPGEAIGHHWLGGRTLVYDTGEVSRYAFSLAVGVMPAGDGPAWHYHTREEEVFYVLDGEWVFETPASGEVTLRPGDAINLPAGLPHRFRNASDSEARVLLYTTPGGNMQFFLDLSRPLGDPAGDAQADPAAFAAAGRTYGIVMLGSDADAADHVQAFNRGRGPKIVRGGAGGSVDAGDGSLRPLFTAADTDGRHEAAVLTLPPGGSLPPVRHGAFSAGMYVLSGRVRFTAEFGDADFSAGGDRPDVGGLTDRVAGEDAMLLAPFGCAYGVANEGDGPATVLFLSGAAGLLSDHYLAGRNHPGVLSVS